MVAFVWGKDEVREMAKRVEGTRGTRSLSSLTVPTLGMDRAQSGRACYAVREVRSRDPLLLFLAYEFKLGVSSPSSLVMLDDNSDPSHFIPP